MQTQSKIILFAAMLATTGLGLAESVTYTVKCHCPPNDSACKAALEGPATIAVEYVSGSSKPLKTQFFEQSGITNRQITLTDFVPYPAKDQPYFYVTASYYSGYVCAAGPTKPDSKNTFSLGIARKPSSNPGDDPGGSPD